MLYAKEQENKNKITILEAIVKANKLPELDHGTTATVFYYKDKLVAIDTGANYILIIIIMQQRKLK